MAVVVHPPAPGPLDSAELLSRLSVLASSGDRTLVVVPVAGRPPDTGDLLIGLEAAEGLPPSVIVMRRDGYAAWSTIHRGTSLRKAYEEARRAEPQGTRLPLSQLADRLASELASA